MSLSKGVGLCGLPDEILIAVVRALAEDGSETLMEDRIQKDIAHLRLTCKLLNEACESSFFQSIHLETTFTCEDSFHPLNVQPQRRLYVQHLRVYVARDPSVSVAYAPSMPKVLPDFVNLQTFQIEAILDGSQHLYNWRAELEEQLKTTPFSALEEVVIHVWAPCGGVLPLQVSCLLRAPRLERLSIQNVGLLKVDTNALPAQRTGLKTPRLKHCKLESEALTTILATPADLDTFEFTVKEKDEHDGFAFSNITNELSLVPQAITILSDKQQSLKRLKLSFQKSSSFLMIPGEPLNFTKLRGLKSMCFKFGGGWIPTEVLDNLPHCEHIEFCATGELNLEVLEMKLRLHWFVTHNRFPSSIRRVDFIAKDRTDPTPEERSRRALSTQRGIHALMKRQGIPYLTYTQRGRTLANVCTAQNIASSPQGEYVLTETRYSRSDTANVPDSPHTISRVRHSDEMYDYGG